MSSFKLIRKQIEGEDKLKEKLKELNLPHHIILTCTSSPDKLAWCSYLFLKSNKPSGGFPPDLYNALIESVVRGMISKEEAKELIGEVVDKLFQEINVLAKGVRDLLKEAGSHVVMRRSDLEKKVEDMLSKVRVVKDLSPTTYERINMIFKQEVGKSVEDLIKEFKPPEKAEVKTVIEAPKEEVGKIMQLRTVEFKQNIPFSKSEKR